MGTYVTKSFDIIFVTKSMKQDIVSFLFALQKSIKVLYCTMYSFTFIFCILQLQFASTLPVVMEKLLVPILYLLISVALNYQAFHMLHPDSVCYVQLLVN